VSLQRADAQVAQAEADYQAAQQDLIARVAQRYFDVLAAQDDLDAQRGHLESVSHQLEQAESATRWDSLRSPTCRKLGGHDSGAAAVIAPSVSWPRRRKSLREITGEDSNTLARRQSRRALDSEPSSEGPLGRDGPAAESIAGVEPPGSDIARENVSSARGGHFPTLDLVASATG